MSEGITLKGDLQVDLMAVVGRLFGFSTRPRKRDWWLVAYTGGLTVVLATMILVLAVGRTVHLSLSSIFLIVALAVAAAVAERQSVRLSDRAWISVSALPIVLAAVIFGPLAAISVSAASLLPSFGRPYARWATWTS